MGLDLRIPLGLMFLSIGAIMLGYGVVTWHDAMYARSLGENINVAWGVVMVLFGATMFLLARRSRGNSKPAAAEEGRPASRRTH